MAHINNDKEKKEEGGRRGAERKLPSSKLDGEDVVGILRQTRHSIQGNRQSQHFSYSTYIVLFGTHTKSLLIVPISSASLEQGEVLCGWLVGELCAGVFLSPFV